MDLRAASNAGLEVEGDEVEKRADTAVKMGETREGGNVKRGVKSTLRWLVDMVSSLADRKYVYLMLNGITFSRKREDPFF